MEIEVLQMDRAVAERVIAIIADQAMLEPTEVTLEMSLDDLGIDSLGLVECIFGIEESFDVTVPFNANTPGENSFDISSVGAIVLAVEGLVANRPA
jgi:acyl carrier protein